MARFGAECKEDAGAEYKEECRAGSLRETLPWSMHRVNKESMGGMQEIYNHVSARPFWWK
jgi:hypothetical protein